MLKMDKNQLLRIASIAFGLIAFVHLMRAIFSWPARIADFEVPVYFSYAAVVAAGCLAWLMYSGSRK